MISGVIIRKLEVHENNEGKILKMMSCHDENFTKFGEIYFSYVNKGIVKGWHKNTRATKNYTVVKGNVLLVLYDGKTIEEIKISEINPYMVTIPPNVWSSFCSTEDSVAIVANLTDKTYTHKDTEKIAPQALTNYWKKK